MPREFKRRLRRAAERLGPEQAPKPRPWGKAPPAPAEGAPAVVVCRHALATATAAVEARYPDPGSPYPKDWLPELKRAVIGDAGVRAANRDLLRAIRATQTNIRVGEPGEGGANFDHD